MAPPTHMKTADTHSAQHAARSWSRLLVLWMTICAMLVVAPLTASAEPPGEAPPDDPPMAEEGEDGPERAGEGALRKRVAEKLRKARREFLVDRLALDDATADSLDALLDAHDRDRKKARNRLQNTRRTLSDALERTPPDDKELEDAINELVEAKRALQDIQLRIITDSETLLTTAQRARLIVELPRFEKKVRKLLREARGKKRRGRSGRKGNRGQGPKRVWEDGEGPGPMGPDDGPPPRRGGKGGPGL